MLLEFDYGWTVKKKGYPIVHRIEEKLPTKLEK